MIDPVRMVFINIISATIALVLVLFYKFVFPKKNIPLVFLLILISLMPLVSMLRPGTYESGDLSEHVKNSMTFYNSLSQGNIIPRWSDTSCGGFGCPDFIFLYIFPYYVISLFHFVGFSF